MTLGKVFMVFLGSILLTAPSALSEWNPFDGERKGFIVSGGIGPGLTYVKTSDALTKGALAVDFKIGYAPTDRLGIHLTYKTSLFLVGKWEEAWYDYFHTGSCSEDIGRRVLMICPVTWFVVPSTLGQNIVGIEGTYHLNAEAPSFFFNAGFGPSSFPDPYKEKEQGLYVMRDGFGLFVGVGYEFAPHWNVQLLFMWSKATEKQGDMNKDASASSLLLTFNGHAY